MRKKKNIAWLLIIICFVVGISPSQIQEVKAVENDGSKVKWFNEDEGLALMENGDLYCWDSYNYAYEDYDRVDDEIVGIHCKPVKILENVVSVSLGGNHSAAITENRDLYCWGYNYHGQVGNGTYCEQNTPEKVLENVISVSLGGSHSAAVTENGDLYCWGYNYFGQVGNGNVLDDQFLPEKILENVVSVSLAGDHSAAITKNGDLYCWGENTYCQVSEILRAQVDEPVKVLENVTSVSLSYDHSAAITENGDLYCWGYNEYGQIGNGTITYSEEMVKVLENVSSVSLGGNHSAAITQNGDLYCWGDEAGLGYTEEEGISKPIKVLENVDTVLLDTPNIAITKNGDMYCWGTYTGHWMSTYRPSLMKLLENVSFALSGVAIKKDGSLWVETFDEDYEPLFIPFYLDISSEDSKEEEFVTTPGNVTEDMLFSTEYCKYLNNSTYNNMIRTLRTDMTNIQAAPQWNDFTIAYRTVLSAGVIGQLKIITEQAIGSTETADKVQEELALRYLNSVYENSEYAADIYETFVNSMQKSSKVVGILKDGFSSAEDIEEVAKALSKSSKYGSQKIANEMLKLVKHKELLGELSEACKIAGKTITAEEIVTSILMVKLTNIETIDHYLSLVPKDSGIYVGLKRNKTKLEQKDIITFAKELAKQEGFEKAMELLGDAVFGKASSVLSFVAAVDVVYSLTGYYMKSQGVLDLEDYLKAETALRDQMVLESTLSEQYLKILNNYLGKESYDVEQLKKDYRCVFELYVSCVLQSPQYLENYSGSEIYYSNLQKDLKAYKSKLTYDKYIKSCLKNANAAYTYTLSDGKATITGVTSESTEKSVKGLSLMSNEENTVDSSLCIEIPEQVDGYDVVAIGKNAINFSEEIFAISLPDTMEEVKDNAFCNCTGLYNVFLSENIKTIGNNAFSNCTNMSYIDLPDRVTSIGDDAFAGIDDLVIIGGVDSAAQEYAVNNNETFCGREKGITKLSIKTNPNKMEYNMSEEPDLTGLILTVTYSDGTTADVTDNFYGVFEEKAIGASSMAICYGGAKILLDVNVLADECEYTIYYVDEVGNIIHEPVVDKAMAGTEVNLPIPEIEGYTPDEEVIIKSIGAYNSFKVTYTSIPNPSIGDAILSFKNSFVETGEAIEPEITIKYGNTTLKENQDYSVEYDNNVKPGVASIWISGLGNYDGIQWCTFTISKKVTEVKTSKITLSGISKQIAAGKKIKLTANVAPANADNKAVTWKSSNTKVATVTQSGVVTMKKDSGGKSVTITATAKDGSGVKATYNIKSMKGIVKKISISGSKSVKAGKSLKLKAKVTATKSANKKLKWTSNNTKYAKVSSSGKVTTYKAGKGKKVKITAVATDGSGKKKTVTIKIK